MAPHEDTPPASPSVVPDPDDGDEPDALDADDVVEVIDLDEGVPDEDDDEDDEEDMEEEGASSSRLEAPPEDNSAVTFSGHGKPVFCCALSPRDAGLAVSGGEDDAAYLWRAEDGKILHKFDGFKDSVVHCGFSHKGRFVAAADMSGVVRAWEVKVEEDGGISANLVWEQDISDITWMSWHPGSNVLFAATVDSELWMWKVPDGQSNVFVGHGERAETAAILADGRRALVGYGDGTMRVFDLRSNEVTHNIAGGAAHAGAVASLDARRDNNLVASGGVDGVARLYSLQSSKPIGAFACGAGSDNDLETSDGEVISKATVEAVLFGDGDSSSSSNSSNVLVTGTLEGVVNVWDVSTQASRCAVNVGRGVTKMRWRNKSEGREVLVSTLDGLVRLVDVRAGKVAADCSGHAESVLDFCQDSDGSRLISSSDDGTCKVFHLDKIISGS